ncbi:MAG: hypothetical protein JXQ90_10590 [Cyclobacteriaceae bacterium]
MGNLGSNEDSFEEQWRKAIEAKTVAPPSRVWERVEHKLAFKQVEAYKKKLFVYKWAAVVAIMVAASISISNYLLPENLQSSTFSLKSEEGVFGKFLNTSIDDGGIEKPQQTASMLEYVALLDDESSDQKIGNQSSISGYNALVLSSKEGRALGRVPFVKSHAVEPIPEWKYRRVSTYSRKRIENKYWAGLSVGADQFDPQYQVQAPSVLSTAVTTAKNFVNTSGGSTTTSKQPTENMEVGMMRQLALNMGMKLTDRVTLESGVRYGEAAVTNYTNVLVENRYYPAAIPVTNESAGLNQINQVAKQKEIVEWEYRDVELNNQFQFATIPLKAGYILVDRRMHLRLNAGVVTNFYLGNTLDHPSDEIATFNISPGDESPYKNLTFAGIAGFSMGYQILNGFDMVFEPNYSHALQSITKNEANFNVNPVGFGMNAGIRYRFK